ncbi:hypothetical protein DH09_17350 [Bacillaceae bacterium JMAK1]|nr:hypothetical protein DH09_17350 [Bacillaceae bacterium JMAK1]
MKRWLNDEEGGVYPLAAGIIIFVLAFGGLLIDGGMTIYHHTKLSSAVDAATVATLDAYDRELWEESGEISLNDNEVRAIATRYLTQNMEEASIRNLTIDASRNRVTLEASATAPLFFMAMFNQYETEVQASASASLDDSNFEGGEEEESDD